MGATSFRLRSITLPLGIVLFLAGLLGAGVPPSNESPQGPSTAEAPDEPPVETEKAGPPDAAEPETEPEAAAKPAQQPDAAPQPAAVAEKPAATPPSPAPAPAQAAVPAPKPPSEPAIAKFDARSGMLSEPTERAETLERLSKLPAAEAKEATVVTKAAREVLEARIGLLDGWIKATAERQALENPKPTPEEEAADLKSELEQLKTSLTKASKDRGSLIPANFKNLPVQISDATRTEIKEAIATAEAESVEASKKVEEARSNATDKKDESTASARVAQDKISQKIATLKAKTQEREKAIIDAPSPEARELARDKLLNTRWESLVETERLRGSELALALRGRRTSVDALRLQALEAQMNLARLVLDAMKALHTGIAAREEKSLQQAAVKEKSRARQIEDPIERYRAKRSAELLELEVQVLADENILTTNPAPTYDQQHDLTRHAETDFATVKALLDDGRVSHLDALRLNNDFRRIGTEREKIVKNELAMSAARLTKYENALSAVELEMVYDARDDHYELENLLERVPEGLHSQVQVMFADFERKHLALLNRRQDTLEKIASRAEETYGQVVRRLQILDEHFGFIRTHIFWVRDEEPVSLATFSQANRELLLVARAMFRLVREFGDRTLWGRFSAEFLVATLGLIVLPWPLLKASRHCRSACIATRTLDPTKTSVAPTSVTL